MNKGTATGIIITVSLLLGGLYLANEEFNLFSILDLDPGECYTNDDCRPGQTCHIDYFSSPAPFDETSGNNNEWCLEVCPSDAAYCEIRRYFSGWKPWVRFERDTTPLSIDEYPYQLYDEECRIYNWEIVVYKYKGECQGAVCGNGILESGEICDSDERLVTEPCVRPSGCDGTRVIRERCSSNCLYYEPVDISPICELTDLCCELDLDPEVVDCEPECIDGNLWEYPEPQVIRYPMCDPETGIVTWPEADCGDPINEGPSVGCGLSCDVSHPCIEVSVDCDPKCDGFDYITYVDDEVECQPDCIGGECVGCISDDVCEIESKEHVIGQCGFGNMRVDTHSPYRVSKDVTVDVIMEDGQNMIFDGEILDEFGDPLLDEKEDDCRIRSGDSCTLNFGKLNMGKYIVSVSSVGGLGRKINIEVWGEVKVQTFPVTNEQTSPIEMYFKVTDHTGQGITDARISDYEIVAIDGGFTTVLEEGEEITYVGTDFQAEPGNYRVNYDAKGNVVKFIGTFEREGYFDGEAEKTIEVMLGEMSIIGASQAAKLNELTTIEWKIVDENNQPVDVDTMTVTVTDKDSILRRSLDLSDLIWLGEGQYSFQQTFDKTQKWEVHILATKDGFDVMSRSITVSVSSGGAGGEEKKFLSDVTFLIISGVAALIVIYVVIRRLRK